ncbi:hypothetical protein FB45DRAFT_910088 [Roridomyces roridus]|uniref:Pentatricopeptide repeat protein n=1 Tax=Roridomyces roridus TaxID=1738132 RepID=A0AAD7BZE8_9AGAR|nr:hypothetical protein FB45DRAFT_910088 [Roridomyces roridus]
MNLRTRLSLLSRQLSTRTPSYLLGLELDSKERTKTRIQSLVDYVEKENFAAAERIRLHLESDHAAITPHPAFERAALDRIRWHGRQDLTGFLTWLNLVPDNPSPSQHVENGPLTRTRNVLFRTGTPARNLLLIKEFSVVCAEKGYAKLVWDDLVGLMPQFEHSDKAVQFFLAFEAALGRYYRKYRPGEREMAISNQRNALIILCCDSGWLDEAVQLVQDSKPYRIRQACVHLLALLRAQNHAARVSLVESCMSRQPDGIPTPDHPKLSTVQRIGNLFTTSGNQPRNVGPSNYSYSTRAVIDGSQSLRPRAWVASQLKELRRLLLTRSLVSYRPPGSSLHSIIAHYDAYKSYQGGLPMLRKRALAVSDTTSYTWLCKEMFYLHESRNFSDIIALFGANFHIAFLPLKPWLLASQMVPLSDPLRIRHSVPTKMEISAADAWVIWNALLRLSPYLPDEHALPVLETLRHSVVHYASKLTDRQFYAFPTSYTAVFRSVIWAYGELGEVDKAVSAAGDISVIGKDSPRNVVLLDELAAVHARTGNVRAASKVLAMLEKMGPRLATYGVMMDGYLRAGLVQEALELELRMKRTCNYVPGVNWRMDATLEAVRAAEDALDPDLT